MPCRSCLSRGVAAALFALAGSCSWRAAAAAPAAAEVREPAVAGLFYPRDPAELAKAIDACLGAAREQPVGELKALICPHAGYPYSGPVAAWGFKLLAGRHFDTAIVLGPSHYAELRAASVSRAGAYRTPLGDVPVSAKARRLAQAAPFALEPACPVERPDWWLQSSRRPPAVDTADTWEHSVEVEVPFLQRTLGSFELVPVVCGEIDTVRAARALEPLLDGRTLVVVSSDLSHYYAYDTARELDRACVDAICRLDTGAMEGQQACGRIPILVLMNVARDLGWKPRLLDARNSGDTSGDKSRVVGYAAIAFYAPFGRRLGPAERSELLRVARASLREAVGKGKAPEAAAAPGLAEPRGCFVTLTEHGALRGCIGNLAARGPLGQQVAANARSAALEDPRFNAVTAAEEDAISIEVSVLTEPRPLYFSSPEDLLAKLQPGVDGVILRIDDAHMATYLPQVWDEIPDKTAFLSSLSEKAGCGASDWRRPGVGVFLYEVEAFKEG